MQFKLAVAGNLSSQEHEQHRKHHNDIPISTSVARFTQDTWTMHQDGTNGYWWHSNRYTSAAIPR